MIHFYIDGEKVAEGWSIVGDDLKELSHHLFLIANLKYSTSTALANPVVITYADKLVGKFLIRDLPNPEPTDDGNFLSKNVTVEYLPQ